MKQRSVFYFLNEACEKTRKPHCLTKKEQEGCACLLLFPYFCMACERGGSLVTITEKEECMKEYKTYIFDLDGTLISSLEDLAASTNYALRQAGLPERTLEEVRTFVGNGVRKLMERAIPDGASHPRFEEIFTTFREHYMLHNLDATRPYDGIMEMLKEMKRRGKHVAVVSNKFYAATQELCQHFFGNYVEVAIGEREGIRKKPAPDTVIEAFRQLGVSRENAVYIGDSDVDIATARNSDLPCISVLWGFRDRDFLLEHGATTFAEKPSDILS